MIVEFQLSLEEQAARWYAQQDISTFTTFQQLVDKFQELFQVKIDPNEEMKEYYSLQQQAGESVAEFLLWFRAVQALLDTAPAKDIQKQHFLKALKEPLRSSFALLDFSTVPLTEVINQALNLDHQQLGLGLSQQFGHSKVECVQHCALCLGNRSVINQALNLDHQQLGLGLSQQFGHSKVECVQHCALCPGNRGGRAFRRNGRPPLQNSQFRLEGADQRQEARQGRKVTGGRTGGQSLRGGLSTPSS
jgi:hypothetical protein